MSFRRLLPSFLFAALLIGWLVTLLLVFGSLRHDTDEQFDRIDASQRLETAMLDQEIGVRGFLSTFEDEDLDPYREAKQRFDALMVQELRRARSEETRAALLRLRSAAGAWQSLAAEDVRRLTLDDTRFRDDLKTREAPIDTFRAELSHYQELLERERERDANSLLRRAVALIVAVSMLVGAIALVVLRRGTLRERRYNRAQAEFAAAMQSAGDEGEADELLKRHLERQLGDEAVVTVLRRTPGDDRLRAGTPPHAGTPLAAGIADARPRDCLAIRRGAAHSQGDEEPLVACGVCGGSGPASCRPLLVGDGIIGSVLVEDPNGRAARDRRVVSDSILQAAPILAGLRTLALAQSRATTDALTQLPNRWALQDALQRMQAQANRSHRPLSLVLLDIDRFKVLNDTWGHDAGDRALVAVGRALTGELRESDLAARTGGEEFAVLLPDTPLQGAMAVAEQLRGAIAAVDLDLDDHSLTASFGVAVLGLHASDAEALMQVADRALYAAKRAGRDRVEVAEAPLPGPRVSSTLDEPDVPVL
ncbi:diguanylate cyclase [Conexibacter sp. CPCC 206217]|uniref:sensor domain-containing diguanylate cyclase n=1 Tax=Conexibacter sp. CPCC 206217 TaxID=3064574 RepID=UPI0027290E8E|nr:diguanylate cyclase [Conexibacter sp. CPCC 206217]MDO8213336.1 diguanylate cyclase [Conexibacter sp. CPCC 206217]